MKYLIISTKSDMIEEVPRRLRSNHRRGAQVAKENAIFEINYKPLRSRRLCGERLL